MAKLSRFTSYGIEDTETPGEVETKDGNEEVTVNAEPTKDTDVDVITNKDDDTTDTTDDSDTSTDETTDENSDDDSEEVEDLDADDLEPSDTDTEEESEDKQKKIKIEIEIAQEQIKTMKSSVTSLESIRKEMEETLQKGGLNAQGRNIAKVALSQVCNKYKVEVPTASMESHGYQIDDFHATIISTESIKNVVEKMQAKIETKSSLLSKLKGFTVKKKTGKLKRFN
jgi:hypothetical protein